MYESNFESEICHLFTSKDDFFFRINKNNIYDNYTLKEGKLATSWPLTFFG
jgi:hypothetical protein